VREEFKTVQTHEASHKRAHIIIIIIVKMDQQWGHPSTHIDIQSITGVFHDMTGQSAKSSHRRRVNENVHSHKAINNQH
jgi:hypothetical protein